jgi:hypothetical protein
MKRTTVLIPMLLPRISDLAAVQLLDILEQLLDCVRHHYAPLIQRCQRHQRTRAQPTRPPPPELDPSELF